MRDWLDKLSYYYNSIVYKFHSMNDYLRSLFVVTNIFCFKMVNQGYTVIDTEDYSRYLSYEELWNLDDNSDSST